jgi:hypothetical protein
MPFLATTRGQPLADLWVRGYNTHQLKKESGVEKDVLKKRVDAKQKPKA